MRVRRTGLLLGLALAAGGCVSEAEDATLEGSCAASSPGAEGAAGEAAGTSPGDYLVRMVGIDGAEVTGTAGFRPAEGETEVVVALESVPNAGMYQGHIHEGDSCDRIGRMRWPLQPVSAEAEAGGEGVTTLSVPVDSVMNGNTVVVFHQQEGQPVVCGDIPVLPPDLPA
jgi:hypothetical protein